MGEGVRIIKTNRQPEPTVFFIFGGAGDFTWRELVPALFDLSRDRSMPADFAVIAVDRADLSDEKLRRRFHDGVKKFWRKGMLKTGMCEVTKMKGRP
jgi:glucose-6-phosphate 1-dehydrogenase